MTISLSNLRVKNNYFYQPSKLKSSQTRSQGSFPQEVKESNLGSGFIKAPKCPSGYASTVRIEEMSVLQTLEVL